MSYVVCVFDQDFLKTLAKDEKDQILLRLISQGRGSFKYAKDIRPEISRSAGPNPGPDRDADAPE